MDNTHHLVRQASCLIMRARRLGTRQHLADRAAVELSTRVPAVAQRELDDVAHDHLGRERELGMRPVAR